MKLVLELHPTTTPVTNAQSHSWSDSECKQGEREKPDDKQGKEGRPAVTGGKGETRGMKAREGRSASREGRTCLDVVQPCAQNKKRSAREAPAPAGPPRSGRKRKKTQGGGEEKGEQGVKPTEGNIRTQETSCAQRSRKTKSQKTKVWMSQ